MRNWLRKSKSVIALGILVCFMFIVFHSNLEAQNALTKQRVINKNPGPTNYPFKTIKELQYNHPDSLAKADSIQNTDPTKYYLQAGNFIYPKNGNSTITNSDSIYTIVGVVIVPVKIFNYTASGYTLVLADTGYFSNPEEFNGPWHCVVIRAPIGSSSDPFPLADSIYYQAMFNLEVGDVVRVDGFNWDFPMPGQGSVMSTTTQFAPLPTSISPNNFEIIASGYPLPERKKFPSNEPNPFYQGTYPGGKIKFSTGEQWEWHYVELYDWTVRTIINPDRGTFDMVNENGDVLGTYDASRYFTTVPGRQDTTYQFSVPPVGSRIDTIRGIMQSVTGTENPRGYRIAPVWPGDIVYGVDLPRMQSHRRYPVVVTPTDSIRIEVTAIRLQNGYPIDSVLIYTSTNYAAFKPFKMSKPSNADTAIASYLITPKSAGTNIRYFFKAFSHEELTGKQYTSIYANAHPLLYSDTSKGYFFFTVKNLPLKIQDVQYTPFANGISPYYGADSVTIDGVITADTSDLTISGIGGPGEGEGTSAWYMQSGNAPWSGIWVVGPESTLAVAKRGDSVRVTGRIYEYISFGGATTTRIDNIRHPIQILASNRPIPDPVSLPTSTFATGVPDGTPSAEQWEGMLVRFDSVNVTNVSPTFASPWEFLVSDGSGQTLIRREGKTVYSNYLPDTLIGKQILSVGDKIVPLTGIVFTGNAKYKITPRKDPDINPGDVYTFNQGWNLVSVPFVPGDSSKSALFPDATSNAFAFANGYVQKDSLVPGVGYWLKFPSITTRRMFGRRLNDLTISVNQGWNLIGSITNQISTSSVVTDPPGNIASSFYAYNNGYVVTNTIQPGKAYWVKVNQAGTLTFGGTSLLFKEETANLANIDNFNTIRITDKNGNSQILYFGLDADENINLSYYEMPPLPPSTLFDVRFASQRILETYPRNIDKELAHTILLQGVEFPITIEWNTTNAFGKNIVMTDGLEGKIIGAKELKGEGSIKVSNSDLKMIQLKIENGEALPTEFSLSQNYPNPFNPTTKMVIALPKSAQVEVNVYDILGRKVKTLVNEVRPAGYHTIEWNGTNELNNLVPSGVYFIRMTSGSFTSVKKIVMLK